MVTSPADTSLLRAAQVASGTTPFSGRVVPVHQARRVLDVVSEGDVCDVVDQGGEPDDARLLVRRGEKDTEGPFYRVVGEGIDNDWNGATDCEDLACLTSGPPCELGEATCDNGQNCGSAQEEPLEAVFLAMCRSVPNPPTECFEDFSVDFCSVNSS